MNVLFRLLTVAALLITSQAHATGPTSYFNQETALITPSGSVQVDLTNAGTTQLRMGAFSGETIVDMGINALLYKKGLSKSLALYGGLGVTTAVGGTATTTVIFGAAYTYQSDSMLFNINPVMVNVGPNSTVDVNLGLFLPMAPGKNYPGRLLPGISVYAPVSPAANATVLLGLRWEVKEQLTLEAGLYNSNSGLQLPGLFRINLAF